MPLVPHFRWNMASQTVPGRRVNTREHLTEAQALAADPTATPLPGTMEMRLSDEVTPEAFDPYDPRWTT
jgi:hypothetical protein